MNNQRLSIAVNLSTGIASIQSTQGIMIGRPGRPTLTICVPSCGEDGIFYPAQSVEIYGVDSLEALRDLIDKGIAFANKGALPDPLAQVCNDALLEGEAK